MPVAFSERGQGEQSKQSSCRDRGGDDFKSQLGQCSIIEVIRIIEITTESLTWVDATSKYVEFGILDKFGLSEPGCVVRNCKGIDLSICCRKISSQVINGAQALRDW